MSESSIELIAIIPLYADQELHLRRRVEGHLEPFLELCQYNTEDGGYRLVTPFPDRPEVVTALTTALVMYQESR